MAVRDEGVGALALGMADETRVVEQGVLLDEGRTSFLWDVGDQGVEQCPEPPGDLILSRAEGTDLVGGELDEVLHVGVGYTSLTALWLSVTVPTDRCFGAA